MKVTLANGDIVVIKPNTCPVGDGWIFAHDQRGTTTGALYRNFADVPKDQLPPNFPEPETLPYELQ